ncbi:unnamed protein product [Pedinophyceae sp. YPF-701]|nr:unnamed protein product [Pedinophyceae sp. YPF-701]
MNAKENRQDDAGRDGEGGSRTQGPLSRPGGGRWDPMQYLLHGLALYFFCRLAGVPMGTPQAKETPTVTYKVPYSQFLKEVKSNQVADVLLDGQYNIDFTPRASSPTALEVRQRYAEQHSGGANIVFSTVRPDTCAVPYDAMTRNGVTFGASERRSNRLGGTLSWVMCLVIVALALRAVIPSGAISGKIGARTKHKSAAPQQSVRFADVAGIDEAKEELQEVVHFLREPETFTRLGARPPKGVLLVGSPGTGKTLLARAVAGEAGVPFFSMSASEFVELYVGMGAMRVRELFAAARAAAPCIVFIDEIDAVAKGRDSRLRSVGNDEREQTLNQLLTEMDGFDSSNALDKPVICIAATNRPDVLDSALMRPGRFDRKVSVGHPDRQGRAEILRVHIGQRKLPLHADVDVDRLAASTTGFTGADLANVVNEAAIMAGRGGGDIVTAADFDAAIMRSVAGVEKKRSILRGLEKSVVARHEVGHALVGAAVAMLLPQMPRVERLSIVPRSSGALGFTYMPPAAEDRALSFDNEIRGQLATLLAGRAAEAVTCPGLSTGAGDDIQRATGLAYRAVAEAGLSTRIGPLNVGVLSSGLDGEAAALLGGGGGAARMAALVEEEVKLLIDTALRVAQDVVEFNRDLHAEISDKLQASERLEGADLEAMLARVMLPQSLKDFVVRGETAALPAAARARAS